MTTYVNVTGSPVHTDEGAMVAPGDRTPEGFDPSQQLNAGLIADGSLLSADTRGVDPVAEPAEVDAEPTIDAEPEAEPSTDAETEPTADETKKPQRGRNTKGATA